MSPIPPTSRLSQPPITGKSLYDMSVLVLILPFSCGQSISNHHSVNLYNLYHRYRFQKQDLEWTNDHASNEDTDSKVSSRIPTVFGYPFTTHNRNLFAVDYMKQHPKTTTGEFGVIYNNLDQATKEVIIFASYFSLARQLIRFGL